MKKTYALRRSFTQGICLLFMLFSAYIPTTLNAQCALSQTEVEVTINSDNFGGETTWQLTDAAGTVLGSGGPFASNAIITESVCACNQAPGSDLTFTIFDSYGDGICCAYGIGSYSVTAAGAVVASGGAFGVSESTSFGTAAPVCDIVLDPLVVVDESCPMAADGSITASGMTCNGPLDFSLSGPVSGTNTTGSFTGLTTGSYTLTVALASDPTCSVVQMVNIVTGAVAAPPVIDCGTPPTMDFPTTAGICGANLTLTPPVVTAPCGIISLVNDFNNTDNASGFYPVGSTAVTWTVTDAFSTTATCIQTINVLDSNPPVVTCPPSSVIDCGEMVMNAATTVAEFTAQGGSIADDCDVTITVVEVILNDICPTTAQQTINRTYTVTDDGGNNTICSQTITLQNSTIGPIITSIPLDQTVDCAVNAFPQLHLFEADGDCPSNTITKTVTELPISGTPGCNGTRIQFQYSATDDCGRVATHTQTYTLANEGPEFICPTDICVINCPADNEMIQAQFDDYATLATVLTSCSENDVTITNSFNPNFFIPQNCSNPTVDIDGAVAFQTVTFRATDFCGRQSTCTALVVIKDGDGPVMSGNVPLGVADCADANLQAGYENWINLALGNLSAMDECSGMATNITYAPFSPNTNCSGGVATTDVVFTSTDACGNESFINATYRIIDSGAIPTATVSGSLMTEENQAVELVEVAVDGSLISNMVMTNADGLYEFPLELNQNHAITPSRNDNHLNGITSYDLILIGQHLLEIQTLDSPYKLIAADVNRSGTISSLDLIQLRRLILHIDEEFTNNTSWRFVDGNYNFPNLSNPFASTFPEAVSINNLSQAELHNFVAIKIGDLNGSAAPTLLNVEGDTRDRNNLVFQVEDQKLSADQIYTVDFKAKDFNEILGYQFTLDFDPAQLEMIDFVSGAIELNAENFGDLATEGVLTSSWNLFSPISIADDEILFSISFRANANINLSQAINLNSSLTPAEAYSQTESTMNLGLKFNTNANLGSTEFALLQNRPNPFNNQTLIAFTLPELTNATLTIYDVAGRIIKQYKGEFNKGYNEITVNRAELSGAGLLYYQLETPTEVATMKMIVQ